MFVIEVLVLIGCLVVCGWTLSALLRTVRGVHKRRLLTRERGVVSDAPDGTGISVVCSGVRDPVQLENLLRVEYSRYEVVLALDACRFFAEFEAIVIRYRMIRVNYTSCDELPVTGVRALYRSRQRCYRRLVLLDRAQSTPYEDFDAAGGVAVYDYLLPVREGALLLPGVVERLAAELSECPSGALELLRSRLAEPAVLVSRETVVREGGFSRRIGRSVPPRNRRILCEPLLYRPCGKRRGGGLWSALSGILLVVAAVLAAERGAWAATALLTTALVVWSALMLALPLLTEQAPLKADCLTTVWRRIRKHSV